MSAHRILYPDLASALPGTPVTILGDEAHHAARVKRLVTGDPVEFLDGRGHRALAVIRDITKAGSSKHPEWLLVCDIQQLTIDPPPRPRVEIWAAPPKGERLEDMIDGLGQVGAAAWCPLLATRTVVDPREGKLARLARVAAETAKQSGRSWTLELGTGGAPHAAITPDARVIIADASGTPYSPSGAELIRVLIGPEGGWTDDELRDLRAAGATLARFGPHVMRVETAAIVAAAAVIAAESRP
jgi:16S rRNA (uracil1498-N3)-methyltransferase